MRWLVVAVALCLVAAEDEPLECPCGLDDKPWPSTPPKDQALVFLHVPKAGTSWTVTMAQVPAACHGVSSAGLGAAPARRHADASARVVAEEQRQADEKRKRDLVEADAARRACRDPRRLDGPTNDGGFLTADGSGVALVDDRAAKRARKEEKKARKAEKKRRKAEKKEKKAAKRAWRARSSSSDS